MIMRNIARVKVWVLVTKTYCPACGTRYDKEKELFSFCPVCKNTFLKSVEH